MPDSRISADERSRAGLCADCVHAREIKSERGSVFVLCELSQREIYGVMAIARTGLPEPRTIFSGAAITIAPVGGS